MLNEVGTLRPLGFPLGIFVKATTGSPERRRVKTQARVTGLPRRVVETHEILAVGRGGWVRRFGIVRGISRGLRFRGVLRSGWVRQVLRRRLVQMLRNRWQLKLLRLTGVMALSPDASGMILRFGKGFADWSDRPVDQASEVLSEFLRSSRVVSQVDFFGTAAGLPACLPVEKQFARTAGALSRCRLRRPGGRPRKVRPAGL